MKDTKKALLLAGKMALLARQVVGGKDVNGFAAPPGNVFSLCETCKALRKALDAYDAEILRLARSEG